MNSQDLSVRSTFTGSTSPAVFIACTNAVSCMRCPLSGFPARRAFYDLSRNVRIEEIISRRPKETTPTGNCSLSSSNRCTHCNASRLFSSNSTNESCATVSALSLVLCDVSLGSVLRYITHSINVLLKISMSSHKFSTCQ